MGFYFVEKAARAESSNEDHKRFRDADSVLEFLARFGLSEVPLNLPKIYELIGPRLKFEPMKNEVSGTLKKSGDSWVATINSLHSENRQNFTMAHELAHYLLHIDSAGTEGFEDTVFFRNANNKGTPTEYDLREVEANKFAAEFLMPKDQFIDYVQNRSKIVSEIANHFKVSPQAVKIRAGQIFLG